MTNKFLRQNKGAIQLNSNLRTVAISVHFLWLTLKKYIYIVIIIICMNVRLKIDVSENMMNMDIFTTTCLETKKQKQTKWFKIMGLSTYGSKRWLRSKPVMPFLRCLSWPALTV